MVDWQRLGLDGPTRDVLVIKRAYARALRHARPDDDAAAYQALREAYDRLLRGAQAAEPGPEAPRADASAESAGESAARSAADRASGSSADTPADAAADIAADTAADIAADAPPPAPRRPAPERDPGATPQALCARLLEAHARGPEAVDELLPELRRQLEALPLRWRPLASTLCADLVLENPDLPLAAKRALEQQFAWLDDFRVGGLLGPRRLEALSAAIGVLRAPLSDPRILLTYADTLALDALVGRGRSVTAAVLAALLGPALERQFEDAGTGLLARLGLDRPRRDRLKTTIERGRRLRAAALGVVLFVACLAVRPELPSAVRHTLELGWVGWLGPRVCGYALASLPTAPKPGTWLARLPWRRLRPWWPWIGVGVLVASSAALAGPGTAQAPPGIGAALALLGVGLAMPKVHDEGIATAALAAYLALWLAPGPPGATLLALAWAMVVILGLRRRKEWAELDFSSSGRRIVKALPLALLVPLFGMPPYVVVVARRAGHALVVSALLLASVPPLAGHPPDAILALPAAVGAIAGMLGMRMAARACARRWIARSAPLALA